MFSELRLILQNNPGVLVSLSFRKGSSVAEQVHRGNDFPLRVAVAIVPTDHEQDDEVPPTTAKKQMQRRRIRSIGDKRQADCDRRSVLSCLPHFDYEHEHRFTEHEQENPSQFAKQNCNASSRCTSSAPGLATHHASHSRATCWLPKMILPRRRGRRR